MTNFIRHFNTFCKSALNDERLHANHVSLYLALFYFWNQHRFCNPFPIRRGQVMALAGIGSKDTYVSCLKALHIFAYIEYQQPRKAYDASYIKMNALVDTRGPGTGPQEIEKTGSQVKHGIRLHMSPGNGSLSDPESGHFYKQVNKSKQTVINGLLPPKKIAKDEIEKVGHAPGAENNKEIERNLPGLSMAGEFFAANGHAVLEGEKFFHHYQANGWRQGAGTLITDWQAAARKWILNIHPLKTVTHEKRTEPGRLHTNQNKNYSEPL